MVEKRVISIRLSDRILRELESFGRPRSPLIEEFIIDGIKKNHRKRQAANGLMLSFFVAVLMSMLA